MGIPQIIMICLIAFNTTAALLKHGEPKGNYNAPLTLFIDLPLMIGLLYYGGFFS